jgi:hypothetical protein
MMNRRWVQLTIIVVVLGGLGWWVWSAFSGDDYPDEWDERVTDLVAFVEDERGHDFEHPVPVDFLDADEYAEVTRQESGALTDEEVAELEQIEGLLRALGLVAGDLDLLEATNDLTDTGTLAYYDFTEDRVVVRGTEVTPDVAVTLVHELTHVLQDQVFGMEPLEASDDDVTSGEQFAYRAIVEGDAGRVEQAYLESLDEEVRSEVEAARDEGIEDVEAEEIPIALQALFGAPYALGDGFLGIVDAEGDVDDAFEQPPATEEHLLDPFGYVSGDDPAEVEVPDAGDAEVLDEGDFGAVSLLLVLAERIDIPTALDAVLGWGGDAYVMFERDGSTCVRYAVTGDEPNDVDELAAALDGWVAAAPAAASATAERDGDVVRVESCDPGADAGGGSGAGLDALTYAATRTLVAADAVSTGADTESALCFADAVLDEFSPEELAADDLPPGFEERVANAAATCQ